MLRLVLFFLLLLFPLDVLGQSLEFSLHRLQGTRPGPTLLVIGGIQGNEPGGFNAAALLATRYRIESGNLWVVPNLNFPSIIKRSRGLHGDMNRKFAKLPESDPEYPQVARIKALITDPQVDLVFNLHDGSGFYHPEYVDPLRNPDRWGQSCIIDQKILNTTAFGDLEKLSRRTVAQVNAKTLEPGHRFRLKNTRTRWDDPEMRKSLTYFAITRNKPAFGIEASKSFPTHIRTYYHLLALEAYMQQAGVDYARDFPLTPSGVNDAISKDVLIAFEDGRIQLRLDDLRPTLGYFPLKKSSQLQIRSNSPLVALVPYRNRYRIHYGNNRLTFIKPQFFDYDDSSDGLEMLIDGQPQRLRFGSMVTVDNEFLVRKEKGYRVNVIGFTRKGKRDESGLKIRAGQLAERFSIDKGGKIYRVEVYRQNRFSGMVLVDFRAQPKGRLPLTLAAAASPDVGRSDN